MEWILPNEMSRETTATDLHSALSLEIFRRERYGPKLRSGMYIPYDWGEKRVADHEIKASS